MRLPFGETQNHKKQCSKALQPCYCCFMDLWIIEGLMENKTHFVAVKGPYNEKLTHSLACQQTQNNTNKYE